MEAAWSEAVPWIAASSRFESGPTVGANQGVWRGAASRESSPVERWDGIDVAVGCSGSDGSRVGKVERTS